LLMWENALADKRWAGLLSSVAQSFGGHMMLRA